MILDTGTENRPIAALIHDDAISFNQHAVDGQLPEFVDNHADPVAFKGIQYAAHQCGLPGTKKAG
jgi:hypothetical protein